IRGTFEGDAWYGESVQVILQGVTSEQAFAHPIANAHSIWELVLHVSAWAQAAVEALKGVPIPRGPWPSDRDFPPITERSEAAWHQGVHKLMSITLDFWHEIEL